MSDIAYARADDTHIAYRVIGEPGRVDVVLVAGALIFSFRNWRCPACNRYLGKQYSPKFCSKCGVVLQ